MINVLLIEDNKGDARLVKEMLAEARGEQFELINVQRMSEALGRLRDQQFDMILLDLSLPDSQRLETFYTVHEYAPHTPIVVLSGLGDEAMGVKAVREGAQDYLIKGQVDSALLVRAVRYAIERKRAEEALVERARVSAFESAVGAALTQSAPLQEILQRCADAMVQQLAAALARIWTLNAEDNVLELQASAGFDTALDGLQSRVPVGQFTIGSAGNGPSHVKTIDNLSAHDRAWADWARQEGLTGIGGYPLIIEDRVVGVMAMFARQPLTEAALEALASAAVGIAQGIDRKRAERELAERETLLRTIIETEPDCVMLLASDGALIDMNSAGLAMIEADSLDQVSGKLFISLILPESRQAFTELTEGVFRGESRMMEYEITGQRGARRFLTTHAVPLRNQAGKIIALLGITRDVTEKKRAEEALRQSEKLAEMGSLLAGVAHELNNPLAIVIAHTFLLGKAGGNGTVVRRAQKIAEAAERCARIVRSFLALARQRPTERQPVKLNQVVREAAELLAYRLNVDTVEVVLDLSENLPLLWADPHQLTQVIVNLINNAHQAMREHPMPRRLTLTSRFIPSRARIQLTVADTGPGVPPEIRLRIFEPFFTTKPPGEGTGLGLSLCQGIIEGHGGIIRLESTQGPGAVVLIELPVEVPASRESNVHVPLVMDSSSPVREKAILVVDDEPEIASVLADLLSVDGHRVETASNGGSALAKLQQKSYDLVMTDIRMPIMDGPSLYREMERRYPTLCRRIIFVTGDALTPETGEWLAKTGRPKLSKPFVFEEVRSIIQRTLQENNGS
jgi:two-component system NtrC family sensor kinase